MVLDPFSAFGLAANVVQFVDFSCKLFTQSLELYHSGSGATRDTENLIGIIDYLQDLCSRLSTLPNPDRGSPSRLAADAALRDLANKCKATGDELLDALQRLRVSGNHGRWKSFSVALATVWKQRKIDGMSRKLESYKSQMTLHLIEQANAIQRDEHTTVLALLQTLQTENRQLETEMEIKIAEMKNDIVGALKQIGEGLKRQMEEQGTRYDPRIDTWFGEWPEEQSPPQGQPPPDVAIDCSKLLEIVNKGNEIATAFEILKSLRFPMMHFRQSKIVDAHPNTFRWMFSENFVQWLQSNESIYWISGKPGCGKSTLMKFLAGNPDTIANLQIWAGSKRLATASFYFWIAGTEIQKSQEGLLQSLLYEVLRKHPQLVAVTFPSRWQESGIHSPGSDPDPWTRQELLAAFTQLKNHDTSSTRFCFFVDGLDEYEGEHTDLIDVLRGLVDAQNIKICLSSRPWNVFEEAFGNTVLRKVYLQDLNKPDIKLYVEDKLEKRSDFQKLKGRDSRCDQILAEIVEKAQGVFLWVYLVVRSLVQGLQNHDRIVDLERRLRDFPSDLEEFFRHIFTSLDAIYRVQTARAFQVSLSASSPLSLLNYWFLDVEEEDPQFAMKMKVQSLEPEELESRNMEMQKRLNGRCKGLLEVTADGWAPEGESVKPPFQPRVDFLHRTVKDFLMTKDMQTMLSSWTRPGFDPNLAICRTLLAEMKTLQMRHQYFERIGPLSDAVEDFIGYAREVEVRTQRTPLELVNEMERVIATCAKAFTKTKSKMARNPWQNWVHDKTAKTKRYQPLDNLLTFAIERGLLIFVQETLKQDKRVLRKKSGRPLLDYALRLPKRRLWSAQEAYPDIQMVKLLLRHGADPNQKWQSSSVWCHYLDKLDQTRGDGEDWPNKICYDSLKELIVYGAAKHAFVRIGIQNEAPPFMQPADVIRHILSPYDAAELLALLDQPWRRNLGPFNWTIQWTTTKYLRIRVGLSKKQMNEEEDLPWGNLRDSLELYEGRRRSFPL